MKLKNTYPPAEKNRLNRKTVLGMVRWPFLFAAYICPIINLLTGGKAWSVIVLVSLYTVWTLVLSPDLVEYNRISQFIKLIVCSCVLLLCIDIFLTPGWAIEVVPIVCFCGLAISGVLFFTDMERQKQNMLPMLLLIFFAIAASITGLCFWREESRWALGLMGAFAAALLIACIATLGNDFLRELRRRFHIR